MKNKKLILVSTLILTVAIVCSILMGCTVSKLQKTGGTLDGSPITADTDPNNIVSQKVNEEQWTSAMDVFEELQNGFGLFNLDAPLYNSVSCKATVKVTGEADSIMELKLTQNAGYLKFNGIETYIEYVEESNTYYRYTAKADGTFVKTKIPQSALDQTTATMNQFITDNDFNNFKYDKNVNGYVGTINYDALIKLIGDFPFNDVTGTVTIKIVNGLPCYLKQEITLMGYTSVSEAIYYDFDTTVIELPQVD